MTRRRFQLHLSTCIVLLFASGGLSYLNFVPELRTATYEIRQYKGRPIEFHEHQNLYGWPMMICREAWNDPFGEPNWHLLAACIDALIALTCLLAIASLCEWRIRRKERQ